MSEIGDLEARMATYEQKLTPTASVDIRGSEEDDNDTSQVTHGASRR